MIGKYVEIIDKNNFYGDMRGTVVDEFRNTVKVEIPFVDRIDKVMFFKHQVMEIEED